MYYNSKSDHRSINETSVFQPVFALFLEGLLNQLQVDVEESNQFEVKHVNKNLILERLIRIKNVDNDDITVQLRGYSDIAIKRKGDEFIAEALQTIFELKSPFKSLYHSASNAEKDQLVAEITTLNCMKSENEMISVKTLLLGALTDMFSINVMIELPRLSECFMSHSVTDSNSYILYLLLLLLDFDEDSISPLIESSRTLTVPVYDDDNVSEYEQPILQNSFGNMNLSNQSRPITRSMQNKDNHNNNENKNDNIRKKLSKEKTDEDYEEDLETLHNIFKSRLPLSDLTEFNLNKIKSNY